MKRITVFLETHLDRIRWWNTIRTESLKTDCEAEFSFRAYDFCLVCYFAPSLLLLLLTMLAVRNDEARARQKAKPIPICSTSTYRYRLRVDVYGWWMCMAHNNWDCENANTTDSGVVLLFATDVSGQCGTKTQSASQQNIFSMVLISCITFVWFDPKCLHMKELTSFIDVTAFHQIKDRCSQTDKKKNW